MDTKQIYQAINAISNKINDIASRLDSFSQMVNRLAEENSEGEFDLADYIADLETRVEALEERNSL